MKDYGKNLGKKIKIKEDIKISLKTLHEPNAPLISLFSLYPVPLQLIVQLVHTVQRTKHALFVRLACTNHPEGSQLVLLAVKT